MITVREATLSDAERILEIYAYYIENTAISFECTVPTIAAFRRRMQTIMQRYPYLVILDDGRVEGYAYASPYKDRAAYAWCCEMSIYLDHRAKKRGLGKRLYAALTNALQAMGIVCMYACIACPDRDDEYLNSNSAEFHAHLGYRKIGEFRHCGYKFGRWYNIVWMEKIIGVHTTPQPPVVPYPELGSR